MQVAKQVYASGAVLTHAQRISRVLNQIERDAELRAYSSLARLRPVVVTESVELAATDGLTIMFNPEFIDILDDAEMVYVMLHEASHIGHMHMLVYNHLAKIDSYITNVSMDYVINNELDELCTKTGTIRRPIWKSGENAGKAIGVYDEQYRDKDTKEIFDILYKEKKEQKGKPEPGDGDGDGDGDGGSTGNDPGDGDGGSTGNDPAGGGDGDIPFDHHDWDNACGMTEEERREAQHEIAQAIEQGKLAAGVTGANVPRAIQNLIKTTVDWREQLRDFLQQASSKGFDNTTFRRLNRRMIGLDLVMPTMYQESLRSIGFFVDTSSSRNDVEIGLSMDCIVSACEELMPDELRVVYWDTEIRNQESYGPCEYANFLETTTPRGGGGTKPQCIKHYLDSLDENDRPEVIVVVTDGVFWGDPEDWNIPTLWAIAGKRNYNNFTAPFGQCIEITD